MESVETNLTINKEEETRVSEQPKYQGQKGQPGIPRAQQLLVRRSWIHWHALWHPQPWRNQHSVLLCCFRAVVGSSSSLKINKSLGMFFYYYYYY